MRRHDRLGRNAARPGRHLNIGVVKDDERRVAAKLERELFDRPGALLHQQFADFGRADEGQLVEASSDWCQLVEVQKPAGVSGSLEMGRPVPELTT